MTATAHCCEGERISIIDSAARTRRWEISCVYYYYLCRIIQTRRVGLVNGRYFWPRNGMLWARSSVCNSRESRLTVRDIEICFAPYRQRCL